MLSRAREKRGLILFLLCAAELLVGVDFAIVNVALPSIQEGLGFSPERLQWVITGLLLPFGGLLLSANPGSLAILLLGLGITGFGHIASIVAFRSIADSGLPDREQGLSAGIANVSQQVGATLGVAIFAAVAVARGNALRRAGTTAEEALVGGGHFAVGTGAALLGLAAIFAVFALHQTGTAKPTTEPAPDRAINPDYSRE